MDIDLLDLMRKIEKDKRNHNLVAYPDDYKNEKKRVEELANSEDDELKVQELENLKYEANIVNLAISIKEDSLKITALSRLTDDPNKVHLAETIKSDKYKLEVINKLKGEIFISNVARSLKTDKYKVEALKQINDEKYKYQIMCEMQDDVLKVQELSKFEDEGYYRAMVVETLKEDKMKIQELKRIKVEHWKAEVASTLKDDKLKMRELEQFKEEDCKATVAISLQDDTLKMEVIKQIKDDGRKSKVARTLNKDILKIQVASQISDERAIISLLETLRAKKKINTYLEEEPECAINLIKNLNPKQILDLHILIDEDITKQAIERNPDSIINVLLASKATTSKTREKLETINTYKEINNSVNTIDSAISNMYMAKGEIKQKEFEEKIGEVYNLLTYNNVPEFIKTFKLFELSKYADAKNLRLESYKNVDINERNKIILADLFKISLDSNDKSLREFAEILKYGEEIQKNLVKKDGKYSLEALNKEEIAILNQYTDTLIDIHNLSVEDNNENKKVIEGTDNIITNLEKLAKEYDKEGIGISGNIILKEMFGKEVTSEISADRILAYMDKKIEKSEKRNTKNSKEMEKGKLHLESGDYVKGISNFSEYLPSMLKNGLKGGEFNQEYSHSDMTPLDLDFGIISEKNINKAGESAKDIDVISTSISGEYGNTWIVLKQYDNKLKNEPNNDIKFARDGEYWTNYKEVSESTQGDRYVRTGVGSLDIDYIVTEEWNPDYGYEMAMAEKFIPVKNAKDEIVFSREDYDKIREQMRGLSYYNADKFEVDKKAKDVSSLFEVYRELGGKEEKITQTKQLLCDEPDKITLAKKDATIKYIKEYFEKIGITVSPEISADLSENSVELIDTGSTGRGTNVPGDGDFDFMLRHNCSPKVITDLEKHIAELSSEECININDGIRSKDVKLPDGQEADIDITYARKDLKLEYTSDMSVKDRLNSIKKDNPEQYKYVIANIVMAKNILKQMGVYKKVGSDGATEHGGFGGIGVENWILQNGGSFSKAIDTYLEVANLKDENGKDISYNKFVEKYPIYDFGNNHREGKRGHDKFSSFLNKNEETGFKFVKENFTKIQEKLKEREKNEKTDEINREENIKNEKKIEDKEQIKIKDKENSRKKIAYKKNNQWKKTSQINRNNRENYEESKLWKSISIENIQQASKSNFKIFSKQNFVLMSRLVSKYVNRSNEREQEQYERG